MKDEHELTIPFHLERDREFWMEVTRIAEQQQWSLGSTLLQLAHHGLGIYAVGGYDRGDMELIIMGAPLE